MWRCKLVVLSLILSSACGRDPIVNGKDTCVPLSELNLAGMRIAVSALHGPIRLSTLSGASETVLLTGNVNAQAWSPAGDRLVYVDDRGNGGDYALSITDTLGHTTRLTVPLSSTWPVWSEDNWIYFFVQTNAPSIMRIRPNGSELFVYGPGKFPTPEPGTTRFAYVEGQYILLSDMIGSGKKDTVTIANNPIDLRWSPNGKWIGYIENGRVTIVSPDGQMKKVLGAVSAGGISWSANSCYLLEGTFADNMALIDVTRETFIPLPVAGLYPAWKP